VHCTIVLHFRDGREFVLSSSSSYSLQDVRSCDLFPSH